MSCVIWPLRHSYWLLREVWYKRITSRIFMKHWLIFVYIHASKLGRVELAYCVACMTQIVQYHYRSNTLNSLRPSDAIWRQWSWTTLAQVMACCLTAPSHYLNQCWLIIRGVLWHTSESSFAGIAQGIDSGYEFEKDILKNIFKSPRGQWVNKAVVVEVQKIKRHWEWSQYMSQPVGIVIQGATYIFPSRICGLTT